jgi:large subunit ribosomal protein L15
MNRLSTLTRLDARSPTRVGRGGKRGKTTGKGTKGQNARAGHHKRPELRDIIKKFPKLRGHGKNRARTVNDSRLVSKTVSLMAIEKAYKAGETVNPSTLVMKRVVMQRGKKLPDIVIVATGALTKSVIIEKVRFSAAAKAAVEAAGGSVK